MAIESGKISESFSVPSNGENSASDEQVQFCRSNVQENENLGFLNDFESYWQDINDRLIVSRVVSDSVIKGMVNAVSQESVEMVSAKQIEVDGLKEQLLEGEMVQRLQEELQVIVMQNAIDSVRERCEMQLLDSDFFASKAICWRDSLKMVSSVCQDLDSAQKSLVSLEKWSSHGSLETDHYHHRVFTNHGSPFSPSRETDVGHKESAVSLPENFESSNLKHLPKDELYTYLKDVVTLIKRDHERTVQAMTDEYFRLKREFLKERELLKERESFSPLKSKDFDVLRKKIPDVILKLNNILLENDDFSEPSNFSRDRMDNLLAENQNLRGLLNDKKREVECLSLQVSEAEEKLMQHILNEEAHMSDMVRDLNKSDMEASIREEVYKCTLRELVSQIEYDDEENKRKSITTQEILATVYEDAMREAEAKMRVKYGEFSNMQIMNMITQEISGNIYQEVLKDMEVQIKTLENKCLHQDELIISLESEASKMEKTLALEAEEKHILEQKIVEIEALIETKDKSLITEREQLKKELKKMTDDAEHQEALIFQKDSELGQWKANLEDSLQQIDQYKDQMDNLTKALDLAQLDSERCALQERSNTNLLLYAKDREYRKKTESAFRAIQEMVEAFMNLELETMENIKLNNLRLEKSTFQLDSLIKKASTLRRTGLLYKQGLERRSTDLQKAEAEVDLLADEVETLLSLLEKIYIALDHYSPVLQHYPGIVEILKLIHRELLNAECTKSFPRSSIRRR